MEEIQKFQRKEEKDDPSLYKDISHTIDGFVETTIGPIKRIKTELMKKDVLHDLHARFKIRRDDFRIATGLYAIGNPDENSKVLVTANYKLTFDKLRAVLKGHDLWIMVIDTKGINVWCAAGKGTFGTEEIINRIKETKLDRILAHRNLILPQLGAPGVSAHIVAKNTGFKVTYGPVRAEDIPEFLAKGCIATEEMRRVEFKFIDRLVLTPLEILISLKYFIVVPIIFFVLNWINNGELAGYEILQLTALNSIPYLGAFLIGGFLVPIMLPILPFRSLALKGLILGIIWSIVVGYFSNTFMLDVGLRMIIGNALILTSIITILGLNFTGATTYTSFSGVKKETLWTVPSVTLASLVGLIILVIEKI